MVVVLAAQAVDVKCNPRTLCEALQAVRDHLAAEIADLLALQAEIYDAVGPVRKVDDSATEGFVKRGIGVAESREPSHGVEGGAKRGAEGNADVFGGVMIIDCVNFSISDTKRTSFEDQWVPYVCKCRGKLEGKLVDSLCRSPLHIIAKLQPACFANACSIWSRKPIPVFTLIVCDLLDCEACPSAPFERSL